MLVGGIVAQRVVHGAVDDELGIGEGRLVHYATSSKRWSSAGAPEGSRKKRVNRFFAVSWRYSAVARQSVSGWKSASNSARTASIVCSVQGLPINAFSTWRARFGVA